MEYLIFNSNSLLLVIFQMIALDAMRFRENFNFAKESSKKTPLNCSIGDIFQKWEIILISQWLKIIGLFCHLKFSSHNLEKGSRNIVTRQYLYSDCNKYI